MAMSDDRLEELERLATVEAASNQTDLYFARAKIGEACREIRRLWAENDRLRQDRSDALNVKSREGLLSSEWIARTGKAERRVKELEARIRKLHSEWWECDGCGHDLDAETAEGHEGREPIYAGEEIGWTCLKLRPVCRECHTDDGEPNENTEYGEYPCATVKALDPIP